MGENNSEKIAIYNILFLTVVILIEKMVKTAFLCTESASDECQKVAPLLFQYNITSILHNIDIETVFHRCMFTSGLSSVYPTRKQE